MPSLEVGFNFFPSAAAAPRRLETGGPWQTTKSRPPPFRQRVSGQFFSFLVVRQGGGASPSLCAEGAFSNHARGAPSPIISGNAFFRRGPTPLHEGSRNPQETAPPPLRLSNEGPPAE